MKPCQITELDAEVKGITAVSTPIGNSLTKMIINFQNKFHLHMSFSKGTHKELEFDSVPTYSDKNLTSSKSRLPYSKPQHLNAAARSKAT